MENRFKHNLLVEERMFCLDLAALKEYDKGFKAAYENGEDYSFGITLKEIFTICPRKRQRSGLYGRLVRFLALKGVKLKITSRKRNKNEVEI